ncbi:MAG: hypothetical protein JSU01_24115 [Bacteroidetes bacterium]|nr:hypothetical protein [Bacteroidota bacterium]
MRKNVFLLATDPKNPNRGVIHARDSGLKISVHCLDGEPFKPDCSEIQLYGRTEDKMYVFETIGIASDDAIDIVGAIQWYGGYIHCPDMVIVHEDPRTDKEIAI